MMSFMPHVEILRMEHFGDKDYIRKSYERILSKCSFPAFPWRSFLKIRLADKEIDELEDSLGYETSMNFGACEIPIELYPLSRTL